MIRSVVTRGYGPSASIALVSTRGYQASAQISAPSALVGGGWIPSRKRWRELKDELERARLAHVALVEKANAESGRKAAALEAAAKVAHEALARAEQSEGIAAELERLTRAMDAAEAAENLAHTLAKAKAVQRAAKALVAAIEEEDEAIALMWLN